MKILLICPSAGYYTRVAPPLGLVSIGTYLKQNGHEVKLYDRCVDKIKICDILKDFSPDTVGVSVISSKGLKDAIKVSKYIKRTGNQPVVWGGPLPSMHIDLVLESDFVDIVSYGEGEETWLELADCFENNKPIYDVQGIAYKKDGKIIENPCRSFMDPKDIPIVDTTMIDVQKYMVNYMGCNKMAYVNSARGCPYKCAFCQNVSFHKSTYRKRLNEAVIEEIKHIIDNHGADGIYFSDELMFLKKSDVQDFCRLVHENHLNFYWGGGLRIGLFDEEDFQMMYDAGCRWILFGVETGSAEMSKKIHKNIDMKKVKPTIDILRKIGISSSCTYIIGFPGETVDQLKDTVNLINCVNADLSPISHFMPLPGTELYNEVVAQKKYEGIKSLEELSKVVTTESVGKNLSAVSTRDLRVIKSWFEWKSFTNKSASASEKPYGFAKETILNGLRLISLKGPVSFFVDGFSALYQFLYIFWYSHAYLGIIKKYNLRK